MFTPWADVDRTFAALDELTRRLDGSFPFPAFDRALNVSGAPPRAAWKETPEALELTLEVPGLGDKDLQVEVERGVLLVSGKPTGTVPERYVPQRRERDGGAFRHAWRLRVPVDEDAVTATLKQGILTLTLPKRAEARARVIPVQAQG